MEFFVSASFFLFDSFLFTFFFQHPFFLIILWSNSDITPMDSVLVLPIQTVKFHKLIWWRSSVRIHSGFFYALLRQLCSVEFSILAEYDKDYFHDEWPIFFCIRLHSRISTNLWIGPTDEKWFWSVCYLLVSKVNISIGGRRLTPLVSKITLVFKLHTYMNSKSNTHSKTRKVRLISYNSHTAKSTPPPSLPGQPSSQQSDDNSPRVKKKH